MAYTANKPPKENHAMHRSFALTRRACYIGYVTEAVAINYAPLLF